ncbi:MAG TPA: hypothetical protein VFZ45_01625 [Actinomycetota bacterium]|nr:hypothetical protein [Actinomycetota bacterium]
MFGRRRGRGQSSPVERVLATIERAKADLVSAVPSPRGVPARPLAEALLAFEEGLRAAAGSPDAPTSWRSAVDESLRRAERLRLEARELDYEGLVEALTDLLAPLDVLEA